MGAETVATLVVTAIIVAALAVYVLAIGLQLRRLSFTLGTILIGLRAIRMQTAPIGAVLEDLVQDVDALDSVLEEMAGAEQPAPAPSEPEPEPAPLLVASASAAGDAPVGTSLMRSTGPSRGRRDTPRRRRRRTPADMRADIARAGQEMERATADTQSTR